MITLTCSPCSDPMPNLCSDGQCHAVDCSTVDAVSSLPGLGPPVALSSPLLVLLIPIAASLGLADCPCL